MSTLNITTKQNAKQLQQALSSPEAGLLDVGDCMQAAVAICLRERNDELEILLMRRAFDENDPWSGQICLPGGRHEVSDESSRVTAERETQEEVGIQLNESHFISRCNDSYAPIISNNKQVHISVYAYLIEKQIRTNINYEVAGCSWTPVSALADSLNYREFSHPQQADKTMQGIAIGTIPQEPEPILWGLTLRILTEFFSKLNLPLAATL